MRSRLAVLLAHPRVTAVRARVHAAAAPLRARARTAWVARVQTAAAAELAPRGALLTEARAEADALLPALRAAEAAAAVALARADRSPITGATTVHAAHARHPGVQGIFAKRGLPRCVDCAVGADETLAEAAFGEGFPLDTLLAELHDLLTAP